MAEIKKFQTIDGSVSYDLPVSDVTVDGISVVASGIAAIDLSLKADSSTTLSGYGITDAYTKTETEELIASSVEPVPVKDVTVDGTSVVSDEKAKLITAAPTETRYTTNPDGTINTPTKIEVATSKTSGIVTGADVATIKSYVDDKVDEKLIMAGSGEMNVLEGVKVGGTALAVTGKNVNIELDETKASGDNGVRSVTLAGGKVRAEYDKFVEASATSGTANQYGFFSGANELTGKKLVDAFASTTSASASAFDEPAGAYTVPTTKAVGEYVEDKLGGLAGALIWKGTVDLAHPLPTLPAVAADATGWECVVGEAGSYGGNDCLVGDILIYNGVAWQKVSSTTTVSNADASIGTASTSLGTINGTTLTAKVEVSPVSGGAQVTTSETKIATVAGKDITAKLKDSSTAYTPGSVTGSGDSQVIVYPTLVSSAADGVVQGSDIAKISGFVEDYCDKMATAAGSGEMNKVDDVKVDGLSIVSSKIASIPDASATGKGVVQLDDVAVSSAHTDKTDAKVMTAKAVMDSLALTKSDGLTGAASGYSSTAAADYALAYGENCRALAPHSHAEGKSVTIAASAKGAHAEGWGGDVQGEYCHKEGYATITTGNYSHAEGKLTIAKNTGEHACGVGNKSDAGQIFSIGIGATGGIDPDTGTEIGPDKILETSRRNAMAVHGVTGDVYVIGVGGYDGKNFGTGAGAQTLQQVINAIDLSPYCKFVELTQAEYDALAVKDPMIIYCITG